MLGSLDDAGQSAVASVLGLRVSLLHLATRYGLRVAIAEGLSDSAASWQTWLDWVSAATDRFGVMIGMAGNDGSEDGPGRRLMDALGKLGAELRAGSEAAGDLLALQSRYDDWTEMLEHLMLTARWVEQAGLQPMRERGVERFGVELLGAIQDSLIVLAYGRGRDALFVAESSEVHRLLCATRGEGAWDPLELTVRSRRPAPEPPATLQIADWREVWPEILGLLDALAMARATYLHLAPDGRLLEGTERAHAVATVHQSSLAMRRVSDLDLELRLPGRRGLPEMDLQTAMEILRGILRGLVLALSSQSERRVDAMTREELQASTRAFAEISPRYRLKLWLLMRRQVAQGIGAR